METIKRAYISVLDSLEGTSDWSKDWRWIALYSLCIYAAVLALRLSFAGRWDHPELWVNGERILATHDAYYWLAKAKGVGVLQGYPLAQLAAFLHEKVGLGFGTLGFWMPAIMGAMVGVVCYLWGWLLAGRTAGIFAGLAGSLTPGFFYRSRLGYFDSDMFTLLMPMAIAWLLAYWVSSHTKSGWFVNKVHTSRGTGGWLAFFTGLTARLAGIWHSDIINILVLYSFSLILFVLINGLKDKKGTAFFQLSVFILAAFPGTYYGLLQLLPLSFFAPMFGKLSPHVFDSIGGITLSFCLMIFLQRSEHRGVSLIKKTWVGLSVVIFVALATKIAIVPFEEIVTKLFIYLAPSQEGATSIGSVSAGPIYPSVVQSIIEARHVPLTVILERGAFSAWLGLLALLSSVVIVFVRPIAILLFPFVLLQLASVSIGVRFTMFGGAALMIFLGCGVHLLINACSFLKSRKKAVSLGMQLVLGCGILLYCQQTYAKLPLTPVISKQHAEALFVVGETTAKDAMIWTWWDWGYASQYYAGRETMADGGKHAGRDVFPVGFSMSTPSTELSNRMIAFSSQYSSPTPYAVGYLPALSWDRVPREEIGETLKAQLARNDYPVKASQYLVVSWKDLRLAKWITYFGNWNLQTGSTVEASIGNYDPGKLGINTQRGAVMNREGGGGLVSDITVLSPDGVETKEYFMNTMSPRLLPQRRHLLINSVTKQSILMDRTAKRSTMTRLLIGDPNDPEISKYFKLVVDKLPFVRIYEVVQ